MTDGKSPADIEREIEEERGALAHSLEELQSQFSPEHLIETASEYLRDHGGDIAESVGQQIKENPMAAAVTGVGLAWLVFGSGQTRPAVHGRSSAPRPAPMHADQDAVSSIHNPAPGPSVGYDDHEYELAPGLSRTGRPAMAGFDDRMERVEGETADRSLWDKAEHEFNAATEAADDIAQRAKRRALEALNAGRHLFDDDNPPRSSSRRGRPVPSQDFLQRISEGTESMSEAARLRVMRARHHAYEAQRQLEERYGDYTDRAGRAFERQPLLGGLLVVGIGALIGAALPRTEREDQAFGAYRDRAFDEAERIYREEEVKLRAVASAAASEAKNVAEDAIRDVKSSTPTGSEAIDQAEGAVKSAVDRVRTAAEREAQKQDLGSNLN